jgi:restriction endonuclease Mrr
VDAPAGISASSYHTAVSKIQEYPLKSESIPLAELQSYVRRNPEALRSIHWRALEKLVAEIFRASRSFQEVIHVGKTNDGGVDVILVATSSERILVQVKRRTRPSIESVSTVRNLLGAMIAHGTLDGIVVSTADHFSSYAQSFVEKLTKGKIAYKIELKDFGKLKEMISSGH